MSVIVEVSTHAPAWGATAMSQALMRLNKVSTHAPAWGATKRVRGGLSPCVVSTHAPAWGATGFPLLLPLQFEVWFQLTRPRGARPAQPAGKYAIQGVSTHAPAWGATCMEQEMLVALSVSTHAPAWGATFYPTPRPL